MADQDDPNLVEMKLGPEGMQALELLQEYFNQRKFDVYTAMLIAGNLHGWVLLCSCDSLGLDAVLAQAERSHAAQQEWIRGNFEALQARREVLRALDRGESGGQIQ